MNSGKRFPDGLSFLLGFSVTAAAFCTGHALAGHTPEAQYLGVRNWIYHWQTLMTGIIALAVGWLTIRAIRDQIDLARVQEADRLTRKLYVAQTALPAALSSLLDYSKASVTTIGNFFEHIDENDCLNYGAEPPTNELLVAPESALAAIHSCIEFENGELRNALAWPVRRVQILSSKLTSIQESVVADTGLIVTRHNLHSRIAEHLEFQVRLLQCFDYARRRQDVPTIDTSIDRERMELRAIIYHDYNFDLQHLNQAIDDLIARRNAGDDR